MSVNEPVGVNALFHCSGSGQTTIAWRVDGSLATDSGIMDQGVSANIVASTSSGTVQSTLTVPATSVNNGTTVQCILASLISGEYNTSNNATLTVIPGELSWIDTIN